MARIAAKVPDRASANRSRSAGRPAETEALNKAGVTSFIYMGCDVVETLARAQAIAGI